MWKDSKDKQHKSTSESSNQKDLALDRLKELLRNKDTPKPTFWNGKYSTTLKQKFKIPAVLHIQCTTHKPPSVRLSYHRVNAVLCTIEP